MNNLIIWLRYTLLLRYANKGIPGVFSPTLCVKNLILNYKS